MPSKTLSVLKTRKHKVVATPSRAREHLEHSGPSRQPQFFMSSKSLNSIPLSIARNRSRRSAEDGGHLDEDPVKSMTNWNSPASSGGYAFEGSAPSSVFPYPPFCQGFLM